MKTEPITQLLDFRTKAIIGELGKDSYRQKGISVNNLFRKISKTVTAKATFINRLKLLESWGVIEITKEKNRKYITLADDFSRFRMQITKLQEGYRAALKKLEIQLKEAETEEEKIKALKLAYTVANGMLWVFGFTVLNNMSYTKTKLQKRVFYNLLFENVNLLDEFFVKFVKILNKNVDETTFLDFHDIMRQKYANSIENTNL